MNIPTLRRRLALGSAALLAAAGTRGGQGPRRCG
jgi:hypothetical protein